jgi:hypothetical protein
MRKRFAVGLVGLCLWAPGCSLVESGFRTLVIEPLQYPEHLEKCLMCSRNHSLAELAWGTYLGQHQGCYSDDFAWGFKRGFVDYLDAGGTGQPPPLPPRRYWKIKYQSPEGYRAIEEWYAGFREGAEAARATGYREHIIVPVAAPSYAAVIQAIQTGAPVNGGVPQPVPPIPAGPSSPPIPAGPTPLIEEEPTPSPPSAAMPAMPAKPSPVMGMLLFDEKGDDHRSPAEQMWPMPSLSPDPAPVMGMMILKEQHDGMKEPAGSGPGPPVSLKPMPALCSDVPSTVWHAQKSAQAGVALEGGPGNQSPNVPK